MRRPVWFAGVLAIVCATSLGCGGSSTPSPEAVPPTVDLGEAAPADAKTVDAKTDMTPVLPIPDDMPPAEGAAATPEIKPIPDEEPVAPKP